MSPYPEAFGPFDPENDPDFAIKLIVAVMVADGHEAMLAALIDGTGEFETIEGEPGWVLERRNPSDDWPSGLDFRARVGPEIMASGFPEVFVERSRLEAYLYAASREAGARRH